MKQIHAAQTPYDAEWLEYDDAVRPPSPFYKEPKMLVKHEIVMTGSREPDSQWGVEFRAPQDEDGTPGSRLRLDPTIWRDMGMPGTVTLTVEPGDGLNG